MGIGINAAMTGYRELQAKGFIAVTRPGTLGIEDEARGPSYELTEVPLSGALVELLALNRRKAASSP